MMLLVLIISSCGDVSIGNYNPDKPDEKEIIALLIQYQDAKNHFDLERLLSCLHDNGAFSFECGLMVSKERLKNELPGFWAGIRSGDPSAIPMVHECINGDYYKSGALNNPQVLIDGDTATATVLFTKGISRVEQFFSLIRENDQWLITRTEWGQS
ncbi:MAG: hypothetical protein ABIL58_06615 [Pseudomonadota bacterium]